MHTCGAGAQNPQEWTGRALRSNLSSVPEQICVPVESSSPLVMSNQKEVLRCLTVLGTKQLGTGPRAPVFLHSPLGVLWAAAVGGGVLTWT